MDLISSKDTLDFLAKSAPRPWIKKLLLWMIYTGELPAYFRIGRIVPKLLFPAFLLHATGSYPPKDERAEFVRKHFDPEVAAKIADLNETDSVEDDATEWNSEEEPHHVSSGFFVFASRIDWDAGSLEADLYFFQKIDEDLFWDAEDHLNSDFENPSYAVSLSGLCFERDAIEMMQPGVELASEIREPIEVRVGRGRPRIWDWDGATMRLLKLAQHPDGLPTGPGAQAQIERLISEWFSETSGNTPSASQVRQHAARIMQALKMPESR
jgi:hypothetical protein